MSINLSMDSTNSNSNSRDGLCTYVSNGVLRTFNSIHRIPANLMNAWMNSTTFQKVMGTAITVYCTAATVYIIYLESRDIHSPMDCLVEFKDNNTFLDRFILEEGQKLSKNYGAHLAIALEKCEEEYHQSGAHETDLSEALGMQLCYPLINKVCKVSKDLLQIMPKLSLLENLQINITENSNELEFIQNSFSCKKV
ncbi:MAG: hypothetical protein WBD50_02490 [Candidatus Rhabdochlamydia sp.]